MELDDLLAQANIKLDEGKNTEGEVPEISLSDDNDDDGALESVIKLIEEEDSEFLIYSSLSGKNPITGDDASMAESMSTVYAEIVNSEVSYSEPTEGFFDSEIEVLKQIIAQTNLGEAEKQIYKKLAPLTEEITTLERWYSNTALKKRNNEIQMLKNYDFIGQYKDKIHYIIMHRDGKIGNFAKLLTDEERSRPEHFITEYDLAIAGNRNLAKELESLENTLEKQQMMIKEKNEEIKAKWIELYKEVEDKVFNQLDNPDEKISKIVAIQYGQALRDKNPNLEVYAKCQCGTSSAFPLSTMMHYLLGDVFHDYHQRTYENKDVKVNLFSRVTSGANKDDSTRYKLIEEDGNEKYRRIVIPGISNDDKAMVCPNCTRIMVPPIDIIDKMLSYGHKINEHTLEASKHKTWGKELVKPGESSAIYGGPVWNSIFDAYLYTPTEIKGTSITADFRRKDNNGTSDVITSLPDNEKRLIARYLGTYSGEVDVKQVRNEIIGYRRSIEIVKDKIVSATRQVSTDNMDETKRLRAMERNKLRKKLHKVIDNNDFVEMCISKRISPMEVEELAKVNEVNIKHLRDMVTEYTRSNLIRIAIEPILEFKDGKWYVGSQDVETPHFKFVLMYQQSLTEFIKNSRKSPNGAENYALMRKLVNIIKTYTLNGTDKELESEKVIKEIRKAMGEAHEKTRDAELMEFVEKFGFAALVNSKGYAPCWLVNDLLRIGIDNIEPASFNTYNSLYPQN
ncbi:MAG: hypothetical protein ABS904_01025 [Solibacillus isronensis]